ncbi:MAG: DUF4358 domain-containing protein [Ruminococcaceae bacterium]|nr:DUF4358 domain-containing protein [Oscillospiraceae bacterium]
MGYNRQILNQRIGRNQNMFKKAVAALLALCLLFSMSACSKKRDVSALTCRDVVDAFRKAYGASYEPNVAIPDELLGNEFDLNISEMDDYYGEMPQIGLRCDRIVVVKAAKGDADKVVERLEAAKKEFLKNTMEYSNTMKVDSALILTEGDFVCFFMLGDDYGGENIGEGSAEETDFYKQQQQIGEQCWHDVFYEK